MMRNKMEILTLNRFSENRLLDVQRFLKMFVESFFRFQCIFR